jgi:DNA polymerase sigma
LAFGSFYNGFGFQQSDLDVCLVFKDEREQNVRRGFFFFSIYSSLLE